MVVDDVIIARHKKLRKILMILLMMILLAIPVLSLGIKINNTSPANNSVITSGFLNFGFSINSTANVSLYINNTFNRSLNLSSKGDFSFTNIEFPDGDYFWNLSGVNHTDATVSGNTNASFFSVQRLTGTLTKTECPVESTATMMALWLVVLISLFFMAIGFTQQLGLIGFFGAIMFMVSSWFIAPCQPFFAMICSLFSFILIIWFVMRHIGNKPGQGVF